MKEKNAICICSLNKSLYLSHQKKDLCKEELIALAPGFRKSDVSSLR
jgi:hypothetical protein